MPLKPLLKLKRIIKGKPLTPSELGYKRDPKTERLTKPGTLKLNAAIDKINKDYGVTKDYAGEYDHIEPAKKKILKTYNTKIELAENKRRADLRRRQLSDWIKKLNVSLSELNHKTVLDYKEELFRDLFTDVINSSKKNIKSNHVLFEEKLRSAFDSRYFSELHTIIQKIGPEKLNSLTFFNTERVLNSIATKLSTEKGQILFELKKKGMVK